MKTATRGTIAYALCAVVVLAGAAALLRVAWSAERDAAATRAEARRAAELRLALWPLDWAVASFLAEQPASGAEAFAHGERRAGDPVFVRSRFVVDAEGVPVEDSPRKGAGGAAPRSGAKAAAFSVEERRRFVAAARAAAGTTAADDAPGVAAGARYADAVNPGFPDAARPTRRPRRQTAGPEQTFEENADERVQTEFENRSFNALEAQRLSVMNAAPPPGDPTPAARISPFRGVWTTAEGETAAALCFVRRVAPPDGPVGYQVVRTDGDAFRAHLAALADDFFPGAAVEAEAGDLEAPDDTGGRLAAAPVRLVPSASAAAAGVSTAFRAGLVVAGGAVLLAVAGGAALLVAAQRLSARRGRFVSAVTHELRTPLTTFRLYADLLADGLVVDERTRREYAESLRAEAARLARVVESVLVFARLEGGAGGLRREPTPWDEAVRGAAAAAARRAEEAGFATRLDTTAAVGRIVRVDRQALEQIAVNLVDNACKYAAAGAARGLEIVAGTDGTRRVFLLVRDYGPGLPSGEEEMVFEPFRRSSAHESGPWPGAGLGLALSRALARAHGGDLRAAKPDGPGAAFRLVLPAA